MFGFNSFVWYDSQDEDEFVEEGNEGLPDAPEIREVALSNIDKRRETRDNVQN